MFHMTMAGWASFPPMTSSFLAYEWRMSIGWRGAPKRDSMRITNKPSEHKLTNNRKSSNS